MKKTKLLGVFIALAVILAFFGYTVHLLNEPVKVEIQGEIEATHIKVASKLPGRIDSLLVRKGQTVSQNTLLFTLTSPEVDAKLVQAQAAQDAATAQENKANNGARNEDVQAAYNVWQKAKAASEYASKSYKRIENLYANGVVPAQKRDEVAMHQKVAHETEKAAKSVYEKAKKGARYEDKQAASALVKRASGAVLEVNAYLEETHIYAPRKGEVANIIAEEGELVPTGYPVVTVVDLEDVWATFHVREDLMKNIKKGGLIKADIPALGMQNVSFKVEYIHVMGDFATWTSTKASGGFDMKTFEIQALPVKKVQGLRPGMSVLVDTKDFTI